MQHLEDDRAVGPWLRALDARHLADLTTREVGRALRSLSSCYVERRGKLVEGGALDTKGKRAAFALFYGPQHFAIARLITTAIPRATEGLSEIIDLGCGSGAAGAAWALSAGGARVLGVDRHSWAVEEANRTYRDLRLIGRALHGDLTKTPIRAARGTGIVAAYTANELPPEGRAKLLTTLLEGHERGARILVIEPIARTITGWWDEWRVTFEQAGGRADEWRFPAGLPERQRTLARSAGLDPRELTARSLFLPERQP
jgi:hypothetical protein